ncbi:DUF6183 family protein [Spirillospora sp. CA-255316]
MKPSELKVVEVGWPAARYAKAVLLAYQAQDDAICEASLFKLGRPLGRVRFGKSVLLRLEAESIWEDRRGDLNVRQADTDEVRKALQYYARRDGLLSHGRNREHAELDAWSSYAALSGALSADAEGPVPERREIARAARQCEWLMFSSPWHTRMAAFWDLGIAALWPGRDTIAILAATDSD